MLKDWNVERLECWWDCFIVGMLKSWKDWLNAGLFYCWNVARLVTMSSQQKTFRLLPFALHLKLTAHHQILDTY